MKNTELSGEAKLKKRERINHTILTVSAILGLISGLTMSFMHFEDAPIPLWMVVGMTVLVMALTVYYYSFRDEYQKSQNYKYITYGVLLALCIIPTWHFAAERNIIPKPHVFVTFFIICIPHYIMSVVTWLTKNERKA